MARKQKKPHNSNPSSSLEPVEHLSSRLQKKLLKRVDKQQKRYRSSGKRYPLVIVQGTTKAMEQEPQQRHKSLLKGTWFGYPLYTAMIFISITAWMLTAVFDVIWLIAHPTWAAYGAFVTVIVGLSAALGAIVTGLTNWRDTNSTKRRKHTFFNVCAMILYIISFMLRLLSVPRDSMVAVMLSFLGLVIVICAAYLDRDRKFAKGTGVNHSVLEVGSDGDEAPLLAERVKENTLYQVTAAGVPLVLLRQGSEFYAVSATCPHDEGPLDEGTLEGDVVECPWDGSRFCMRDGCVLTGPATMNVPCYEVHVRNSQVLVRLVDEP
jgi:nitrite reductase/ring-hydroxylating ferredoxin subunit